MRVGREGAPLLSAVYGGRAELGVFHVKHFWYRERCQSNAVDRLSGAHWPISAWKRAMFRVA